MNKETKVKIKEKCAEILGYVVGLKLTNNIPQEIFDRITVSVNSIAELVEGGDDKCDEN